MKREDIKAKILELTGLSEEQYFFLQIDFGTHYLREVIKVKEEHLQDLIASKLFWSWWINHWEKRDMVMLQKLHVNPFQFITYTDWIHVEGCEPVCEFEVFTCEEDFLKFYLLKNDPISLEVYPSRIIMEEVYYKNAVKPAFRTEKELLKIN